MQNNTKYYSNAVNVILILSIDSESFKVNNSVKVIDMWNESQFGQKLKFVQIEWGPATEWDIFLCRCIK